ncbi:MAG: DivIVA domain-containing protein [Clostridia bacterium]|nr:DivIVA domain-containing protein [Clostridia bacterium]
MISPHELKNKAFTRGMRGYNTQEVDEHLDFLLSEYTELYKENDELTSRISKLEGELAAYSEDSEAIRTALLSAQKVSAKIIDEANAKAELIVKSVKESCDAKLEEIKSDIVKECEILNSLRAIRNKYEVALRVAITSADRTMADLPEMEEALASADDAVREILQNVRDGISAKTSNEEETDEE